jgi:hypothetical protein
LHIPFSTGYQDQDATIPEDLTVLEKWGEGLANAIQ